MWAVVAEHRLMAELLLRLFAQQFVIGAISNKQKFACADVRTELRPTQRVLRQENYSLWNSQNTVRAITKGDSLRVIINVQVRV